MSRASWLTFITHLFFHQSVSETRRGAGTEYSSDMCYSCVMMQSEFEEDEPWACPLLYEASSPITDTLVNQLWPFLCLYMFHNMSCSSFPTSLASCSFNYTVLFNLSTSEKDNMTVILATPIQQFWLIRQQFSDTSWQKSPVWMTCGKQAGGLTEQHGITLFCQPWERKYMGTQVGTELGS